VSVREIEKERKICKEKGRERMQRAIKKRRKKDRKSGVRDRERDILNLSVCETDTNRETGKKIGGEKSQFSKILQ
jgi:hypothetical protein